MKRKPLFVLVLFFFVSTLTCFAQVKNQDAIFLQMVETLSKNKAFNDVRERFSAAKDYKYRLIVENTGTPITELTVTSKYIVSSLSNIEKENLGYYMKVTSLTFSNDSSCMSFEFVSKDDSKLNGEITLMPNMPSSTYDLKNFKTKYKTSSSSATIKSNSSVSTETLL